MKAAILGAGGIARSMARTLNGMEDATLYAIGSRNIQKAEIFKEEFGAVKAYGSYEDLVQDPEVDLVYIATPHSHHFEHMKLCIEHGKNVLCEKAFTANAEQARKIAALAREKKVFTAEAIWTRYMPSRRMIDEVLSSGIVGKISMATCNLSYDIDGNARITDPALAGGALLDVGVYGLNFFAMHLGHGIEKMDSSVRMTERGVDERESITLHYDNGILATTCHGIYGRSDRLGIFYCEKGYIVVHNINNPQSIDVYDDRDALVQHLDVPKQITGYEYEVQECRRMIEEGRIESESMPLDESIAMMEMMDRLRGDWNMKYPFE